MSEENLVVDENTEPKIVEIIKKPPKAFFDPKRLRTNSFVLASSAIGAGILNIFYYLNKGVLALPYNLRISGLLLGVLMLIFGYITTYWSFVLMIEADNRTGGHKTIKELYTACGGKKLALVYDWFMIFTEFCSLVGNQMIGIFAYLLENSCKNDTNYS